MFPILQIGPLAIQLPGLILLLGVWLGTLTAERSARRNQLASADISNLIFYALLGGIVGARLGYGLRYLDLYLEAPLGIFALNPQTLSPVEGVVGAVLVALIIGQRKSLPFWKTLDVLALGLAVFMILLGFANLASGDAFGAESNLPWAIELWGAMRHPTQIYEMVLAGLIFYMLHRMQVSPRFEGFVFLTFTALTAIGRYLIEAFRGDSLIILGGFRSAQLISLVTLSIVLILLHMRAQHADGSNPEERMV